MKLITTATVKNSTLTRTPACQRRERDTFQRISEMTAKEKTPSGGRRIWRWRWNSVLHTSPVLNPGRSPLAPQGRKGSKFVQPKTLSFSIYTSQHLKLSQVEKGEGPEQLKGLKPRAWAVQSR